MLRYFPALLTMTFLRGIAHAQGDLVTTAIPNACGLAGFFACVENGPGCCPVGLICGQNQLCLSEPLDSTTTSASVPKCTGLRGYHSCAQSLGGNCCPIGFTCATAADAPCGLTLRLNVVTETMMMTVGSMVSAWTTTRIDPPSTAADRVPEVIDDSTTVHATLTTSQIGGIIGGVIGAAALAVLVGIVHLIRRRRQQRLAANRPEDLSQKGELDGDGWQRAELHEMTSGSNMSELDGHKAITELSGKNGPTELVGTQLQHELAGGYESHGTSELYGGVPYSRFSIISQPGT